MPTNSAAWLRAKQPALQIGPAPYTPPRDDEIVVKNRAVAINPVDWIVLDLGISTIFPWLEYPLVLGSDVAGEVVDVGKAVTRFRVGDRVLGHAVGMDKQRNSTAEGAFQKYTVLLAHMASPIPDTLSYERAVVLPLGLSTAACGLFQRDALALQHPSVPPRPTGKTLLVWGGSTSVGSNAIQLGVAAGYEVFTTASPRNFDYVKRLGASQVFDYRSPSAVEELIGAFQGKTLAGALAVGSGSATACLEIVQACQGNRFVSMASFPVSMENLPRGPARIFAFAGLLLKLLWFNVSKWVKSRRHHLRTNFIFGSSLLGNEVGPLIYQDFLPKALAEGKYVAAPDPEVVGQGLASIQTGCDVQKKGMSAKKVVVLL